MTYVEGETRKQSFCESVWRGVSQAHKSARPCYGATSDTSDRGISEETSRHDYRRSMIYVRINLLWV
jgi:hypothetical protein